MVEFLASGVRHNAKAKTESPGRLLLSVVYIDIRTEESRPGPRLPRAGRKGEHNVRTRALRFRRAAQGQRRARFDRYPQIGYPQTIISNLPTFASTMMMPLCNTEAGPSGM
jgi:hypothetical protein